MELVYLSAEGKEITWLVAEVERGQSYRIVDDNGNPSPQQVNHMVGGARTVILFDGFVIEGNKVYATALIARDPKIEVGHSPRTA